MDLNDLKAILQREGGKIIIVENGNPTLIVSLYQNGQKETPQGMPEEEPELQDIPEQDPDSGELTVDDLPL
ncbi:MAG: hypothetical protein HYS60_00015 [Candidatus Wildermuthbacteria bacterium]|nr:hypothetical protein [Candidatus Wildermuthbacteria bacterium]